MEKSLPKLDSCLCQRCKFCILYFARSKLYSTLSNIAILYYPRFNMSVYFYYPVYNMSVYFYYLRYNMSVHFYYPRCNMSVHIYFPV